MVLEDKQWELWREKSLCWALKVTFNIIILFLSFKFIISLTTKNKKKTTTKNSIFLMVTIKYWYSSSL